jgi:hypothetical protein
MNLELIAPYLFALLTALVSGWAGIYFNRRSIKADIITKLESVIADNLEYSMKWQGQLDAMDVKLVEYKKKLNSSKMSATEIETSSAT